MQRILRYFVAWGDFSKKLPSAWAALALQAWLIYEQGWNPLNHAESPWHPLSVACNLIVGVQQLIFTRAWLRANRPDGTRYTKNNPWGDQ